MRSSLGLLLALCWASGAAAQTADDYRRAQRFLPASMEQQTRNLAVRYGWRAGEDTLWYERTTAAGTKQFVLFDARSGKESISSEPPPEAAAPPETGHVLSPDGRMEAFLKDFNLWVRNRATGAEHALTSDGGEHHAYATYGGDILRWVTVRRRNLPDPPQVRWSPDSRYLLTHRLDEREVRPTRLLDVVPTDGSPLPRTYDFRYPLPGDEHVPMAAPIVFDVVTRKRIDIQIAPMTATYRTPTGVGDVWWSPDRANIYLLARDRYSRRHVLWKADPASGASRQLIEENSHTFGAINGVFGSRVHTLANGDILWCSERDGWNHLYYYRSDGTLRNPITRGDWMVRSVVHIDERARKIYFLGGGRESARNPYFAHLYVVGFDGEQLKLLTPENAHHEPRATPGVQRRQEWRMDAPYVPSGAFSASGRFFVDLFSTPQQPTKFVLRAANGKLIRELLSADIAPLQAGGFIVPESFQVLAADGSTPIYGNLFRPSNFDARRRYPVIDSIYPGPQTTRSAWGFRQAVFDWTAAQAYAELGFIVVTVDGRGTPGRSKAFWDEQYGRMQTAGTLEDHIAALRQLAQRHSYMDLDRVGIYGHSGGGYASGRAILTYPEFYKVAVALAGDHEQSSYQAMWAEFFQGPGGDYRQLDNARLAAALKGKLLLMHGDLDENVLPSQTLRLADALIQAHRPFDLALVPGANHMDVAFGIHPWVFRYTGDYFIRHLLGQEPPAWE